MRPGTSYDLIFGYYSAGEDGITSDMFGRSSYRTVCVRLTGSSQAFFD
jgi:hypothetical protein